MLFNSETKRVVFEPGDSIRCKTPNDAAELADIFCDRAIPWEMFYEKDGKKGIWIAVLSEEAAEQ